MLIVCGGTETEPNYFNSLRRELRLSTVEVVVKGTSRDPLKVIDSAISLRLDRKDYPFDDVWCVLDVENPVENPLFAKATDKALGGKIELAVSNPAFEYWYLLHFKETSQPFSDASHLLDALESFLPKYTKSADVFPEIFKHTDVAIQRASRLLSNHPDKGKSYPNPSTTVFLLVKSLRDILK
jgi:hypothetical protein